MYECSLIPPDFHGFRNKATTLSTQHVMVFEGTTYVAN